MKRTILFLAILCCSIAAVAQSVTDISALTQKAEAGDAYSQYYLGYCYDTGKGVAQNYQKAVNWYTKAADQGNADAAFNLGLCYEQGKGVKKDDIMAVLLYMQAAEGGNAGAMCNLGIYNYHGQSGVAQDYAKAAYWFRRSALQKYAMGMGNLGLCYELGKGVPQNYMDALYWYTAATDAGHKDLEEHKIRCISALKKQPAEPNDPVAQYELGQCFYFGKAFGFAVEQDYKKAVYYLTKSAQQGYAEAQIRLGTCYIDGNGVGRDVQKAFYWFKQAAEQGNAIGQYNVARCYAKGEGVEKSISTSIEWYEKAAHQGYAPAQKVLWNYYDDDDPWSSWFNGEDKAAYWKKKYEENPNKEE